MGTIYYKSKIDWWFWSLLLIIAFFNCMLGCIIAGSWNPGIIEISLFLFVIILFGYVISTVKYAIRGKELGIRGLTMKWEWLPIDKIESIKPTRSISASSALSFDRIAIKFSDKEVLKSSMPLEISPKEKKEFSIALKSINPKVKILNP